MATARTPFIGGNCKCAAKRAEAQSIVTRLNDMGTLPDNVQVFVSPSSIHLSEVSHLEGFGAFTGEHTPEMLLDSGIEWTLVGHSERRHVMGESSARCGEKAARALAAGMSVVFCIGEKKEQREDGTTMTVLVEQLKPLVDTIDAAAWSRVVLAYEPVWAIGTGLVATPEQAQETHAQLRGWLSSNVSPEVAAAVRIIYGGSVKAANCESLIVLPDVDGFLVGGASLKPEFADIVRCVSAL